MLRILCTHLSREVNTRLMLTIAYRFPPPPSPADRGYKDTNKLHLMSRPQEEGDYYVELPRGSRGFGFSIRGGQEFNCMPLFVLRIAEGGSADLDGRLRVSTNILI